MINTKHRYNKYEDDLMIVNSTVTEIVEKNTVINEKYKNVFMCESASGTPRMCILWSQSNLEVGDEVEMRGRINNGVFLCWKLYIKE